MKWWEFMMMNSMVLVVQAATDVLVVSRKLESKQLLQRWKKLWRLLREL